MYAVYIWLWRAATVRTRALEYPELVMSMSNLLFVDLSTLALAAATGKTAAFSSY